ncbi:hypothetical protein PR048_032227 [Dryococelus australis]|uniref:Maturase K n=1 Tax=Dryococelus australis TaxID=614101 RepID=A0ABQ9G5Q9_9NEOP|nr:hypothetical protein PR048_032227 [Dryococelus australis]
MTYIPNWLEDFHLLTPRLIFWHQHLNPRYKTSPFDDEARILIKCRRNFSRVTNSSTHSLAGYCCLIFQETKNKRFAVGETSIECEMDDYLSTSPISSGSQFQQVQSFPNKYFQQGGLIVTDHRSLLLPDHVNQLVFLQENLRYLK